MYHQGDWKHLGRKLLRLPHTYFVVTGAGLGYLGFILWLGMRLITLVGGGAIALIMLITWVWQVKQIQGLQADNLLEREIYLEKLATVAKRLGERSPANWTETLNWAKESQIFAQRIATKEPILTPELFETLHTVIALLDQVVEAILALEQVETDTYRTLTQQHLQASCQRLQDTYIQLQHLQDQVLLSALETGEVKAGLPNYLQTVIADNKTTLQTLIAQSKRDL